MNLIYHFVKFLKLVIKSQYVTNIISLAYLQNVGKSLQFQANFGGCMHFCKYTFSIVSK